MCSDVYFETGGLDELDIQIKLFELGVESFSPYASTGKVDMIIRSDADQHVRYADIKICTGRKEDQHVIWKLEISFFMNNKSFLLLTFRIPSKDDDALEKNYFILDSEVFLKIMKKEKIVSEDKFWILNLPYSELQHVKSKKKLSPKSKLLKALRPHTNRWETIVKWARNTE
jgi:hypothetical protein